MQLVNDGTIRFTSGFDTDNGGWDQDLDIGTGTLELGTPCVIGSTHEVTGNYNGEGTFRVEYFPITASLEAFGALAVDGSATIGGQFEFDVQGTTPPDLGSEFAILTAENGIFGQFDNAFYELGNGLFANLYYEDTKSTIDQVTVRIEAQALPVELLNFQAEVIKKQVELSWQTAQERNNAGFVIQRSANGKMWEEIRFVSGVGDSDIKQSYTYIDQQPLRGTSYYRLQQLDEDGAFSYSFIIPVVLTSGEEWQVFPVPTQHRVQFSGPISGPYQIMDAQGQVVADGRVGADQRAIDVSSLPSGVYYLRFSADNALGTKKIIKL